MLQSKVPFNPAPGLRLHNDAFSSFSLMAQNPFQYARLLTAFAVPYLVALGQT
jgi:hypothetical protein